MAGALRRTMVYLGLADGEEYSNEEELASHQVKEKTVVSEEKAEDKKTEFHAPVTPIKRSSGNEAGLHQIITVHPRSYNDAKIIGESFRDGLPVVMNVTDMGETDAKRLVDFAAGLVFGMRGSIERVTNKVFLLSPSFVEVLGEDKKTAELKAHVFNQS